MRQFVVVRRDNPKLLEILGAAFRHRTGFTVIRDRRTRDDDRRSARRHDSAADRRLDEDGWNGHDFLVAEQQDPML